MTAPLVWWCLGILAGVGAASFMPGVSPLLLLLLGAGLAVLLLRWRPKGRGLLAGAAVVCILLGGARYEHHRAVLAADPLAELRDSGLVTFRGVVEQPPQPRDVSARWRLQVSDVWSDAAQRWEPADGLALVYARRFPEVRYGDAVLVKGRLEPPPQLDNFDYQAYLARQGVRTVVRYPTVQVLEHDLGNPVVAAIAGLRHRLAAGLDAALPEPHSALAKGMLLGERSAIPQSITDDFRRTGTTHILAISGHNLSVVAALLILLAGRVVGRLHPAYTLGLLVIFWGYTALVGFEPPVVRAAIMASMVVIAYALGRQRSSGIALLASAAAMTLFDPYLLWDLGFQFSFLAMTGIVYGLPVLQKASEAIFPSGAAGVVQGLPGPLQGILGFLSEAALATLAATLAILPVQVGNFQTAPFTALPATALILPAFVILLPAALLTALLGLLSPLLALVPAFVTWVTGGYMLGVVHAWAQAPGASVQIASPPAWLGWLYLGVLGGVAWAGGRWRLDAGGAPWHAQVAPVLPWPLGRREWAVAGVAGLLLVANLGVWGAWLRGSDDTVRLRFLDIGQGDAMLLETPGGQRMVIDGGPSPSALLNQLGGRLPLWDRRIDVVVLTHPQLDHITGLLSVLERYSVGAVVETGVRSDRPEYAAWERLIRERNIPRYTLGTGSRITFGDRSDAKIEVLYPAEDDLQKLASNANNTSLVLQLHAHGFRALLTGDIEKPAETRLLPMGDAIDTDVLKLAHHGSKTSTTGLFLEVTTPSVAVVSAGAGNSFGHPAPEVVDRLDDVPLLRTDLDGTIELRITPDGAFVQGERFRSRAALFTPR